MNNRVLVHCQQTSTLSTFCLERVTLFENQQELMETVAPKILFGSRQHDAERTWVVAPTPLVTCASLWKTRRLVSSVSSHQVVLHNNNHQLWWVDCEQDNIMDALQTVDKCETILSSTGSSCHVLQVEMSEKTIVDQLSTLILPESVFITIETEETYSRIELYGETQDCRIVFVEFLSLFNHLIIGNTLLDPASYCFSHLNRHKKTISTAESCTGGFLSSLLTNVGSIGDSFKGGIVAYSESVKINQLGINGETISKYGAVSSETAIEMANNCCEKFQTDLAVATTGYAGPTSKNWPIGTVFIAICDRKGHSIVEKFMFTGSRSTVIKKASYTTLTMIGKFLDLSEKGHYLP
ncbi:hypothetical protein RCL1_005263 [Eukaryota sp. TZLM3-RCL]